MLRDEFDLDGYRTDRLEFYGDTMVITVGRNEVAWIDGLGRVVATHVLDGYEMHHNFDVTDDGKVVTLATETVKGSVEDVLVSLDLETGTYEKTVDWSPDCDSVIVNARPPPRKQASARVQQEVVG